MDQIDLFLLGLLLEVAHRKPRTGFLRVYEFDGEVIRPFPGRPELHERFARLCRDGLVVAMGEGEDDDTEYRITPSGIVVALSQRKKLLRYATDTYTYCDDLEDTFDALFAASDEVPASDRIVTLNHNQPDYQEAVAALDKMVEAFRDDHRLDNELGHEKGALLKALEAGRELLNDTAVNVRIGTALLVEPLQRLVMKYEKELVGALASTALTLVLKLFGLG